MLRKSMCWVINNKKQLIGSIMVFFVLLVCAGVLLLNFIHTPDNKSFYVKFRDAQLKYEWDFNKSLSKDTGGHTYNTTYFQLKKFSLINELFMKAPYEVTYNVPYEITYKHEEGHILIDHILNTSNFDLYVASKCSSLNVSDCNSSNSSYRKYVRSVSEGIADYYSINYFNNSNSRVYWKYIQRHKKVYMFHYQGFMYVNHSLSLGVYLNLTELIYDFGSQKQHYNYIAFLEQLHD